MIIKTVVLVAACVLAIPSSGRAASTEHRHSDHRMLGRHALPMSHSRVRVFEPRFNPYAYGFQPDSSAEERWFARAKGNIW